MGSGLVFCKMGLVVLECEVRLPPSKAFVAREAVPGGGIEPPTQGFSVLTNVLNTKPLRLYREPGSGQRQWG
jgi:hypothetical protein